jgi:hypothetical protein
MESTSLYVLYSHGNNEAHGIYTTLEQAVENMPNDWENDCCWIHAVHANKNHDFLQDRKSIVKDSYDDLKKELVKKKRAIFMCPSFLEENGFSNNVKILCSSSALNREIVEKFYSVYIDYFNDLIGVPVILRKDEDNQPIFSREYSFREKCFIIQATIDNADLYTDPKDIPTLHLDRIIDL